MIRGTIDFIDADCVVGWVHSSVASVRDRVVLAFMGDDCVGSGKVDVHRPDLAQAGLDDGYVGFHFGITLPSAEALDQVVVRFEGSDLSLLQRGQAVRQAAAVAATGKAGYSHASINWLREQGWIGQVEFDFLKQISMLGLYDRSLRLARRESLDAVAEVKRMLELFHQAPLTIEEEELPPPSFTSADMRRDPEMLTIVALQAAEGALNIFEGSHREAPGGEPASGAGSVRYLLRQDRLLFIDTRASFECEISSSAVLYRARRPANGRHGV